MAFPADSQINPSTFNTTKLRGNSQVVGSETVTVLELDPDGYILRATGLTKPTDTTAGYAKGALFIDTDTADGTEALYQNKGSITSASFVQIKQGSSGATGSLDEAYSNGRSITVDEGPVVFGDATTGALDTVQITKTGAGSGDALQIAMNAADTGKAVYIDMDLAIAATGIHLDNGATARTGADILVTGDSTGTHSVFDVNWTGAGTMTVLDFDGTYAGSPGGAVIDSTFGNAANLDTTHIKITTGTGVHTGPTLDINDASTGSADIIDIDLTGVYTGDVFDFASSAAATGNVLNLVMDNAVAMTAIRVTGAGVRTQPFIELISTATGSADMIDLSADGAFTGDVIDADMTTAVGGRVMHVTGSGSRTEDLFQIDDDSTGTAHVFDINISGIYAGNVIDITYATAAATGDAISVAMGTAVAGSAIVLTGAGARTDDLIKIDDSSTGNSHIFDINMTGVYTGNVLDISFATAAATGDAIVVAMGTAVAGSALVVSGAGARTDDLFKIDDSSTSSGCLFDINLTGAFTTNVAFDLNASADHTSGLMLLTSNSADTGARNLLGVINDNTAAVGAVPLYLQQDAVTSTNFKKLITLGTFSIWTGNETTPNGNLSGTKGDILLDGSATGQAFWCTGTTNWTALA